MQVKHNYQYIGRAISTYTYKYKNHAHALLNVWFSNVQHYIFIMICDHHWTSTHHVAIVNVSNRPGIGDLGKLLLKGAPCHWLNRFRTWRLDEIKKCKVLKLWCQNCFLNKLWLQHYFWWNKKTGQLKCHEMSGHFEIYHPLSKWNLKDSVVAW